LDDGVRVVGYGHQGLLGVLLAGLGIRKIGLVGLVRRGMGLYWEEGGKGCTGVFHGRLYFY